MEDPAEEVPPQQQPLYVRFANGEVQALDTSDGERVPHHDYAVPVPFIWSSAIFAMVTNYKEAHEIYEGDIDQWDRDSMAGIQDSDTLYDLYLAASTLEIEGLMNLCADRIADAVKGLTADQVKSAFNIVTGMDQAEELEAQNLHRDVLFVAPLN